MAGKKDVLEFKRLLEALIVVEEEFKRYLPIVAVVIAAAMALRLRELRRRYK